MLNGVKGWLVPRNVSNSFCAQARISGVRFVTSSRVIVSFASGAGSVGIGCVGDVISPATVLFGTFISVIGNSDSPVTRSKMYMNPNLLVAATASTRLPLRLTVSRIGGAAKSESHKSWRVAWKCQSFFPVLASSAMTQLA